MSSKKVAATGCFLLLMMPGLALGGLDAQHTIVPDGAEPLHGWARNGADFWLNCFDGTPTPVRCRPQRIVSPDGLKAIEIVYRGEGERRARLHILAPGMPVRTMDPDRVAPPDFAGGPTAELIWSPDSRAFLLNGHAAGYWGFFVQVFSLADPNLRPKNPTRSAEIELAKSLRSWCRIAVPGHQADCRPILQAARFNMSAVDWLPDSSGIAVFAEVPSSSSQGIIMGQSRGYEIGVLGHHFLRAMPTIEFKARWQSSAGWKIAIPETRAQTLETLGQGQAPRHR